MSQKRIAVFPGSFDPFTMGHMDVVDRSVKLFDEIIVAIGTNALKNGMLTPTERKSMIEQAVKNYSNVRVERYEGLTIDYCLKNEARYMLRGVRNVIDFEYEKSIAQMNASMHHEVETVMLFTSSVYSAINSSIVRDILRNEGNIESYLPTGVSLPDRFSS